MAAAPLFGVIAPGRPVITDFRPVSETKCVAEFVDPTPISELTFFMLPTTPIPNGFGAILYYAVPPFEHWEIIGAVTPQKPSGIFRTRWATKEDMIGCPLVQLGVSIESLEVINNLELLLSGVEDRRQFAHKIALDLFQYMTSFSHPSQNGMMIIPTNLLDKWMERFDRKYSLDPNFMMKPPT
mmetsp:Transcript_27903/g.28188  ORF Transcript_27903/g.28188 Transcript_27903/m.28188 type:complete len:183 (-) Transcript_27903:132-680(-)